MVEEKKPGRLQQLFTAVEKREREPPAKPQSYWARSRAIIRRRIITGILFLVPIATTLWFLNFFLGSIYTHVEPSIRPALTGWGMDPEHAGYKAVGLVTSILVVLASLYLFGLITSRAAVRRLISLAEHLVERIPFVKFFYKTSKQIVETVAMPSKGALKKVVLIDFPYPGIKAIAFATGETPLVGLSEPFVNVFVATTPNPTSGYLVLLPRSQVWETDLTMEEGVKFIVSGGILHPDNVTFSPYRSPEPALVALPTGESGSTQEE